MDLARADPVLEITQAASSTPAAAHDLQARMVEII